MVKFRYILFVVLLGLAGCNPAAKVHISGAEVPSLNGLSSVHGRATVVNEGARDITVESARFVVWYRDRELGSARLLLPIAIPADAQTPIRYDFALEGVSLGSMQTLGSRIFTRTDSFTVDVEGYVKWGAMRKKISLHRVPLTAFLGIISNFAP
jgi:hypothetical protein